MRGLVIDDLTLIVPYFRGRYCRPTT